MRPAWATCSRERRKRQHVSMPIESQPHLSVPAPENWELGQSREKKGQSGRDRGWRRWGGGEASAEVMSAEMVQLRAPQEYLG